MSHETRVDSRWWYWVAAVPVYFVLSIVFAVLLFVAFVAGAAAMPRTGGFLLFGLFGVVVLFYVLPALVFTVLFPLAIYLDAEAVNAANLDWRPDSTLYGLVALVGVLATAFTVSVPLGLYYLYQRHRHVGVP